MSYDDLISALDEFSAELFARREFSESEVLEKASRIIYGLSLEESETVSPA